MCGERGERAASTLSNERYRMEAEVMPYFRDLDVREITYDVIDGFLERLSDRGLSAATLKLHLSTVRKVLVHAHQRNYISHLPALPTIESDDNPRGHFTREEFKHLMRTAVRMEAERHTVRYAGDTAARTVVTSHAACAKTVQFGKQPPWLGLTLPPGQRPSCVFMARRQCLDGIVWAVT
jgi:hypothetical protein